MGRVKSTSKAAFLSLIDKKRIGPTASAMYRFIVENPGCSRNDIERSGFRQSSVAGRVNGLIHKSGVVREDGCKKDPITGESVARLYPVMPGALVSAGELGRTGMTA